jgi:hypothetical protein
MEDVGYDSHITILGGEVSHLSKGERLMVLAGLRQSATTAVTRIPPLPHPLLEDQRVLQVPLP